MNAHLLRVVLYMAVIASLLTACKSHPALIDTSSGESVVSDIRAHLPIGSSRAKVDAYLDERKIHHDWIKSGDQFPGNPSTDSDTGLPIQPGPTEEAVIKIGNVQTNSLDLAIQVGIVIDLKFDASRSKLVDFSVRRLFKGS